jgi:cytochrome c-type biogenesis protein CcmE
MTRKQRRAVFIAGGLGTLAVSAGLVLSALRTEVTFFFSPSDVTKNPPATETRFRLGGLVKTGSVRKEPDAVALFTVTDGAASIPVRYKGILPDLFRENQGVVTEGRLTAAGEFVADSVLAKHDEKYMPPEVADALKKTGHWQAHQDANAKTPRS